LQGGGVILDLIHEIDVARWMFGEFDRVAAMAGKLSSLDIRSEDTACLVLGKRNGGPLVSISLDYVSRRRIRRYEIVGEQGTLAWDFTMARLELITRDRTETIGNGDTDFDVNQTYVAAMREFLDAVESGSPTSQDIFEGIRSTDLALRAREAAGL
jgi:predicted dehydrogenase